MDSLPDEIILLIFKHASGYDLTTSFQLVCTRWNYLINGTDSVWKGDTRIKGIAEGKCQQRFLKILQDAPKVKYLEIGGKYSTAETKTVLETIRNHNTEIEQLHVIDGYPLLDSIRFIMALPKFQTLTITLDKLYDRREKISELRELFFNLPKIENSSIDFCQWIRFRCEKISGDEWDITHTLGY